jgi:hypothetical protein
VELRVNDADAPIWGNLSNTSLGGCQVETAGLISGGAKVEIGLWVASGKIWVKGLCTERSGHAQRTGCGRASSFRRNGFHRKRESPPVSQICPRGYEVVEKREQLPAIAEIRETFPRSSVFSIFSPFFTYPPTLARKKLVHSVRS